MKEDKYSLIPNEIISHAEAHLTNEDGLFVEGISGEGVLSNVVVIDDLGDFLPFIGYFGREDIVDRHLTFVENNKHSIRFTRAFAYSDFLFGLLWYARIGTHSDRARSLAIYFGEQAYKDFFNGMPSSRREFGCKLPFLSSLDATFIEVWTEFYRDTGDERYLEYALTLYRTFTKGGVFKKTGLLPEWVPTGPVSIFDSHIPSKKFNCARLMKNNTSFGFALVDLYNLTKEDEIKSTLDYLIEGISRHAIVRGGVIPYAFRGESEIPYLTPSFAAIDMLCDAYAALHNQTHLDLAQEIADFWLKEQSATTGLFPNESKGTESYFDSETDMAVSLFKLYEHTENEHYLHSAYETIDGILKYHKRKEGYALRVDIHTGNVTDRTQKTKFSLLLLKPFVYCFEHTKIYSNDTLFMLLKDR